MKSFWQSSLINVSSSSTGRHLRTELCSAAGSDWNGAAKPTHVRPVFSKKPCCPGYARLLGDAMKGDATLFAREDAVEAAWRVVDPILDDAVRPFEYEPGTWGPAEADRDHRPLGRLARSRGRDAEITIVTGSDPDRRGGS